MAKTVAPNRTFAEKLNAELGSREMGRRTLARQLSQRRGGRQSVETLRRLLNKYLSGDVVPTPASRHEIEDTLDLKRDALKPDDDVEDRAALTLDEFLLQRVDQRFDQLLRELEEIEQT